MPKLVPQKEKFRREKSRAGKFRGVFAWVFLAIAIMLLVGGAFWQRAGFELTNAGVSEMTQYEVFGKLFIEYLTSPETLPGLASLALSIVIFSLEQRQRNQERNATIREQLEHLQLLPFWEKLIRFIELEKRSKEEKWFGYLLDELQRIRNTFSEGETMRVIGESLQGGNSADDLSDIQKIYNYFFESQKGIDALVQIVKSPIDLQENTLALISSIMELWDKFDVDSKDLIVGALKRLSQRIGLSNISSKELLEQIFDTANRRRLLRDAEIRMLFPQLANSAVPPVGYNAAWRHLSKKVNNPKILEWLGQHALTVNPFGAGDFTNYPFYPEGATRPDHWEDFLNPLPQLIRCPTPEDVRVLAFLLRSECLPTKNIDEVGNEIVHSGMQAFPIWVSWGYTVPAETPLLTLVRAVAQAWLDILPLSPDAMLDLLPAEQIALLELLCWSFGSNITVINLLKRAGLRDNVAGSVIVHKLQQFENRFSSIHLPPDSVLISWLRIRPPDINSTYLILPLDEIPTAAKVWWLEQFSPLISTLFLNGVIAKAFSSSQFSVRLPLSEIQLNWPDENLKTSLNSQFDAAMKKADQEMGKVTNFRSLFGSDPTIGYFESEENTTNRLISSSQNSLARMLTLGNRLLQHHCEHRTKDGVPEKYLYVEDFETILKPA